jgi:hypothetical protein
VVTTPAAGGSKHSERKRHTPTTLEQSRQAQKQHRNEYMKMYRAKKMEVCFSWLLSFDYYNAALQTKQQPSTRTCYQLHLHWSTPMIYQPK